MTEFCYPGGIPTFEDYQIPSGRIIFDFKIASGLPAAVVFALRGT
jgi:hypothetical protein